VKTFRVSCLALVLSCAASAQYQYYHEEYANEGGWDHPSWHVNGSMTGGAYTGLIGSYSGTGALISVIPVPDGSSDYEVASIFAFDPNNYGGVYAQLLRASSDAMLGQGAYYSVEFQNPVAAAGNGVCTGTLVVNKRINDVMTTLASAETTCAGDTITIRSILAANNKILVYANNVLVHQVTDGEIASGQPGVSFSATYGNGATYLALGPRDRIAPNNVSISGSPSWNRIDLQWSAGTDDANGIGVSFYRIARNGVFVKDSSTLAYSDNTAVPNTVYTYTITTFDQHMNSSAGTTFSILTPPNPAVDTPPMSGASRPMSNPPARIGVRPTGTYWGVGGEQIDMLSGNLNFTLPLLNAQGRGGWSVNLALNYNSQIWRQDSGGTWNLGLDVGYGFGWRLIAGSITPYWSDSNTLHHYVFTDSSGAEYTLGVNSNGVWTSTEGTYVSYNSSNAKLSFTDGSFWLMNGVSSALEPDGGTHYPTLMQDTNGNQVLLHYQTGAGSSWPDTSARIWAIEDVRPLLAYAPPYAYTFSYNSDPIPHLTGITNYLTTAETYTFTYIANQTISSPFGYDPSSAVTAPLLQRVTNTNAIDHTFEYSGGSGEMTRIVLPYGGSLRWAYRNFLFAGGKTIREVQYRYLSKASGAAETQYTLSRDPNDSNLGWHSGATLADPTGALRNWTFTTSPSTWLDGMLSAFSQQAASGQPVLRRQDFTWTQGPVGNPYIGSAVTTLDPGTAYQKQSKTAQTIDAHGNATSASLYDFGNLSTPARTYSTAYLAGTEYASRNIWNRPVQTTVTNGAQTAVLSTSSYDDYASCGSLTTVTGQRLQDAANYGVGFIYRGNPTTRSTTFPAYDCFRYDITGSVTASYGSSGTIILASSPATNYAAPVAITANNYTTSLSYNGFLAVTSATGQNSETAGTTYGGGRPVSITSPHGAVTSISYGNNPPKTYQTSTNGPSVTTSLDGLGRPVRVETGDSGGIKSIVDTEYDSCACSPTGKMKRTSLPYAPGGTVYWTTYTYDGLGRTISTVAPDGATTTYLYQGNTTTITDPAGKWKKYVSDAMGNLIQVIEPDPGSGGSGGGGGNSAAFVRLDTTTQGNWKGVYGGAGYNIVGDAVSYPSYVTVTPNGNFLAVWATSTSDIRALQKAASATDRIAAAWTNDGSFTVDLNFSDQATHQVAIYGLDFDSTVRAQTVSILDAGTNAALDTRNMTGYNGGQYMVWNLSGHVIVKVTRTAGSGALLSGLFFDTAPGGGGTGGGTLTTSYTYDLLNHVTQVTMPRSTGMQTRTFNYNFGTTVTAFLQSATNPENGTVNYTYNGDGNLTTKTDAKGQKIVYTWDSSKRLTQVQHYPAPGNVEDVCQRVTYYYDADPFSGAFSQYAWGRRTGVEYGCGLGYSMTLHQFRERYSYTPGGLVTRKRLTVTDAPNPDLPDSLQSVSLDTAQTYDNAGKVLTVKYPDTLGGCCSGQNYVVPGATFTYTYDGMARPITLTEDRQTPLNWVNNVQYGPAGELKSMDYKTATGMTFPDGRLTYTGLTETRMYNNRLQLTRLTTQSVDMEYRYSATQNNGQITQQKDWVTGEEVSYQYDSLQRLISAVTTGPEWGQSFTYDGFGNRTGAAVTKGTAPSSSMVYDASTNRIVGGSYDANGNMLNPQGTSLGYDIENRVVSAVASGGTEYYAYAPDGKRIWKQKPNGSMELYFHGISGQKLGTYNVTTNVNPNTLAIYVWDVNVYFGSKMIVSRSGPVSRDRLGSSRTGGSKYYPYGEEQQVTAQDKDKFATYFRDATGLDYAQNRYYANTLGRFTSPDPAGLAAADTADPRGWNMYAYVGADPINHYDRTGLLAQYICDAQFASPADCGEGDPLDEGSGNRGADGFNCDTGVTPFASTSAACSLYRAQIGLLFAQQPPSAAKPRVPTSIRVWAASVATPCSSTNKGSFGLQLSITYQILGDDGQSFQQAGLVPLEKLTNFKLNGIDSGTDWTEFKPLGKPTNASGQFTDQPYGLCATSKTTVTATQAIAVVFGGVQYTIRVNNLIFQATGRNQGIVSNGVDVRIEVP
jgi:RHS repeat-associated protein